MFTCFICGKPILNEEMFARIDIGLGTGPALVHLEHHGVKELYAERYGSDLRNLGIGVELQLREQLLRPVGKSARLMDKLMSDTRDRLLTALGVPDILTGRTAGSRGEGEGGAP